MMVKFNTLIVCCLLLIFESSCKDDDVVKGNGEEEIVTGASERNLVRAMELFDNAASAHFTGSGMAMARYYNPYTETKSDDIGSVWMYTSAIEAANSILKGLLEQKNNGNTELYTLYFDHYSSMLSDLYENLDYYEGTFKLTSYTQTKQWSVYGVNRSNSIGSAGVDGILNVYDDQMWLIRELVDSYELTGEIEYLEKAEYLTDYVLDGWDCTLDNNGNEYGGITWGPGYTSKHACSNSPLISALVLLHEIYENKSEEIAALYIDPSDKVTRRLKYVNKGEYYLDFAKKIYFWQKDALLRSDGVYDDFMGGFYGNGPQFEVINGFTYRKANPCPDRIGPAYSYNSGTMISGAAYLYKVTGDNIYLEDGKKLSDSSFEYFAKLGTTVPGYFTYSITGFNNWFNCVLMRGYLDMFSYHQDASLFINSFQDNLDYGYENFLYNGFLPTNLLVGWSQVSSNNRTEAMFNFTFASEYALLSCYELNK
ncbi:glycoside hydrolase family 76 protein [Plebeiibacterium sediminum]|uniref:Glycoside hydrolase family 76 protein n=1 Tax=Plebeiibacterium sediminum TaxID=2992112 RepID=A0AAE3SGC2_9BACT|nr:glycoside hydrolase family 76 protein [Plebeiobacterium sediminum]MCW3787937.1 glycoside hydrolase family 76 protein [Plebeiobacterium sediminum]